jgi:hypothetical protein
METCIEVDSYYKIPKTTTSWMLTKITRRLSYTLRKLKTGDCFGHEEILQLLTRKCRVRSISNCLLIYMNDDGFNRLVPQSEKDKLR